MIEGVVQHERAKTNKPEHRTLTMPAEWSTIDETPLNSNKLGKLVSSGQTEIEQGATLNVTWKKGRIVPATHVLLHPHLRPGQGAEQQKNAMNLGSPEDGRTIHLSFYHAP